MNGGSPWLALGWSRSPVGLGRHGVAVETARDEVFLCCADEVAFTEEVGGGAGCGVEVAQRLEHLWLIEPDEGGRRRASGRWARLGAVTCDEEGGGGRVRWERFEHDEGGGHRGVVDDEEMGCRRWSQADRTSGPDGLEVFARLCLGRPAGGRAAAIVDLDLEVGGAFGGIRSPDGVATAEGPVAIGELEQEVLPWRVVEAEEIGRGHGDESHVRRDLVDADHFEVEQIGPFQAPAEHVVGNRATGADGKPFRH